MEFNVTQEAVWKKPEEDLGIIDEVEVAKDSSSLDEAFQRLSPGISDDDFVDLASDQPPLVTVPEEEEDLLPKETFSDDELPKEMQGFPDDSQWIETLSERKGKQFLAF